MRSRLPSNLRTSFGRPRSMVRSIPPPLAACTPVQGATPQWAPQHAAQPPARQPYQPTPQVREVQRAAKHDLDQIWKGADADMETIFAGAGQRGVDV